MNFDIVVSKGKSTYNTPTRKMAIPALSVTKGNNICPNKAFREEYYPHCPTSLFYILGQHKVTKDYYLVLSEQRFPNCLVFSHSQGAYTTQCKSLCKVLGKEGTTVRYSISSPSTKNGLTSFKLTKLMEDSVATVFNLNPVVTHDTAINQIQIGKQERKKQKGG